MYIFCPYVSDFLAEAKQRAEALALARAQAEAAAEQELLDRKREQVHPQSSPTFAIVPCVQQ